MKSVAVHSGKFHADEVFAIAVLKKLYPELEVIRTRDPEKFNSVDARVDVGFAYNPDTLDFDHHQKEGAGDRENGMPYASFGLIWKNYGMQLVSDKAAWEVVDKSLVQPIDADDCGISIYERTKKLGVYTLSKLIARMNPNWKEHVSADNQFFEAVQLAIMILERELITANNLSAANDVVKAAIENRTDNRYVVLDTYCPWKKLVKEHDEILYVMFPGTNQWCINAVDEEEFVSKKPFPESWRGLEKEELQNVSGIVGAAFCHKTGFFFATETKEEAIDAIKKSLEN